MAKSARCARLGGLRNSSWALVSRSSAGRTASALSQPSLQQPEPWLIATTLPTAAETKRYYRLRMGIEEMFKDLKHSFALESCQCQTTDCLTRLGLFALVSFRALALLVRFSACWVRYVTARGALSFLTLALEWLDAPPRIRRLIRQEARSG